MDPSSDHLFRVSLTDGEVSPQEFQVGSISNLEGMTLLSSLDAPQPVSEHGTLRRQKAVSLLCAYALASCALLGYALFLPYIRRACGLGSAIDFLMLNEC